MRGLYLRLFGRIQLLTSDGEITVTENGEPVSAVRDDDVREAGGELGWQFRTRLRVGVRASYGEADVAVHHLRCPRAPRRPDRPVQPAPAELPIGRMCVRAGM